MDSRWQDRSCNRLLTSDPHLATRRTGHELNVSDSLFQLIENRNAPSYKGATIHRRLDALGSAVEEPDPKRVFKVGDHLGNGGLRNTELLRSLGHASMLNNCHEHVQIAELEPAADLTLPIDLSQHW
jgi:hypothetical protein